MTAPVSTYVHRRRVAFHEVDSAGIVHFSIFFRYMEEAEHAMWRSAGMSVAARDATVGFPRVSAAFDYHRPLRFEDEFEARIRIVAMGETSLRYECVIRRDDEKIATGRITVVCVTRRPDGTMTAMPVPAAVRERFGVAPGDDPA